MGRVKKYEEWPYHCVPRKTTGIPRATPPPSLLLWRRGALGGLGSLLVSLAGTWHNACSDSLPPVRREVEDIEGHAIFSIK